MQQTIEAKGAPPQDEATSSLAFLNHIKKLLDGLEKSRFLFTRAKVPCMHMCIWAVTSILKVFEHQPELFIQLNGPPPPASDDDPESESKSDTAKVDIEMQEYEDPSESAQPHPSSQLVQQPAALAEHSASDDESDMEEEDGEEEMDQSSYDSEEGEDLIEGNEDLSSNRDQSIDDHDMGDDMESDGELDEYDETSSFSDYGDESSSVLIELIPRVPIQSIAPIKGPGSAGGEPIPAIDLSFEIPLH